MKWSSLFAAHIGVSSIVIVSTFSAKADLAPKLSAVMVSATVQTSPPQIDLHWPADTNATGYTIYRKNLSETNWSVGPIIGGTATNYVDTNVSDGSAYEYKIVKETSPDLTIPYTGWGYIYAGIRAPLIENRGKIILVVANTYADALASELDRLNQDLIGDGWQVIRHDVSETNSVPSVKALIKADYEADTNQTKAVFLFGHVPVPYSGNISPDGHPQHTGAWPADVYYGEMDGKWTDTLVDTRLNPAGSQPEKTANVNIPGDGKFDQGLLPSDVDLEVGRVDLSDMTCYSNKTPSRSELDLLRQYLNKDHAFRHGLIATKRQALVCDNFSDKGTDRIGNSAWRNFSAFFGFENITEVGWDEYFPTVTTNHYLWSFGSGGGEYYYASGIGTSDDFALQDIRAVFTMFMGSFFGDWNNESNFLRAPLGSGDALTSTYSGFPHSFFHHMALGLNIGYGILLSQNNATNGTYAPPNEGTRQVHIALMGDPTLRLHPVLPPSNLLISTSAQTLTLSWSNSIDSNIAGYHIYRATSPDGPFARVSGANPISGNSFGDTPPAGDVTYMVRAIKLETSGSGTYYNPSQGIFIAAHSSGSETNSVISISALKDRSGLPVIHLSGRPGQGYIIQVTQGTNWSDLANGTLTGATYDFIDPALSRMQYRFYRVRTAP